MEQPEYIQNLVNDIQDTLNAEYYKFHTSKIMIEQKIDNLKKTKRDIKDDWNTYNDLSDEIVKLEQEKSEIESKIMVVRLKKETFENLIKKLINKYGNDKSKWHSDALDLINKYKKHNFSFPMPRNRASLSVQLTKLPPDGYFDGGKRHKTKTKTKTKTKRSKIIGARCCTRRSRRR